MRILLEAPLITQSGYGEHSRVVYDSIKDRGFDLYINPLNWGNTSWTRTENLESIKKYIQNYHNYMQECKKNNTNPQFDMQIHVGILNEFEKKAPYSVCVTAGIETDRVSSSWLLKTHQGVDKIIVPSEHSKKSFLSVAYEVQNNETKEKNVLRCNSPIDVVPYPIKNVSEEPLDIELNTNFNFLSVALLGPRKNIENSLKWFLEEFKNEEDVGLILKTAFSKSTVIDRYLTRRHLKDIVSQHKDSKCSIYLLHGNLSEGQLQSLYKNPKVKSFVSISHGEGYGLPIFESAYTGLPIIATDWSAHLDFLQADHKQAKKTKNKKLFAKVNYKLAQIPKQAVWDNILTEDSQWAYPQEHSFKKQLRNVYKNHGMYNSWAKSLQKNIQKTHAPEIVYDAMFKALMPPNYQTQQEKENTSKEIDEMFASLSEQ